MMRKLQFICRILIIVVAFLASVARADQFEPLVEVYSNVVQPGSKLGILISSQTIKQIIQRQNNPGQVQRLLCFKLSVSNPKSDWTIPASPSIYLENGSRHYLSAPICPAGKPNCGALSSGAELTLTFELDDNFDLQQDSTLVIPTGIYSWNAPVGEYILNIYSGFKLKTEIVVDNSNRLYRIFVQTVPGMTRFVWTVPADEPGNSISTVQIETREGKLKRRFPVFADGRREFDVLLEAYVEGQQEPIRATIRVKGTAPISSPVPPGETLVGLCFYKSDPNATAKTEQWSAPPIIQTRYCWQYVDEFIDQELGNLAVFWPGAPGKSDKSPNLERDVIAKLADKGLYSMTIYKRDSRQDVEKTVVAGKNRFFLNNNIGEFASCMYQDVKSARASGFKQSLIDVKSCRDFFTEEFMTRGAKNYHACYDYIFSTSGSSLANYELEGGIDFMCSELYAIGAQNLAWASAEMRGAARKWQPEFWGGWLAHEWQTCDYPYQAPQKFQLLKAGLYQQYLMGSRFIVLESGSQTTQAGFYTADSGKKNYGYDDQYPTEYRRLMKEFYAFVRQAPKRFDSPQTNIAVAMGNGDGYIGLFLENLPVWAQHETAQKDSRWKYGSPERASQAVQQVFFPCHPSATAPYSNRFLAGSPYGQTDVICLDEFTRVKDLSRYKLIVYSGWNTMTPEILKTVTQFVEQGGTVFLATPHLSTRTDREYRLYKPSDLIGAGDLKPLMDVEIVDRQDGAGTIKSDWIPDSAASFNASIAIFKPLELSDKASPVETLASVDGKPLLIRQRRGQGAVYLLLTWNYPSDEMTKPLFQSVLKKLGKEFSGVKAGDIDVVADTAPAETLSWAVYKDSVDLLNLDCNRSRTVTIALPDAPDKPITVTLAPAELKTIKRR